MHRLAPLGGMKFDDFDEGQRHGPCQALGVRAIGPAHFDLAEAQAHLGAARRTLVRGQQVKAARRRQGQPFHHARQGAASRHGAIVHHPRQQMNVAARQRRPFGIDVAFAVGHDGDGRSIGQHGLGLDGRIDPAARFLVLERPFGVRGLDPASARIDAAGHQTQATTTRCVDGHHRMHQHTVAAALADFAQAAPPLGRGGEVDLARILDCQHVPAGHRRHRLLAPALDQPLHRHLVIGQQPMETDFLPPLTLTQPAQADVLPRDHAIEQHRPLLSRRRSPNRPNDRWSFNIATPRINAKCQHRITQAAPAATPISPPSQSAAPQTTKMCACRSLVGRG
jgi:hypothetical protein